jgi:nitrogen fixation/metabolism regulation signal transduction histidine kinase
MIILLSLCGILVWAGSLGVGLSVSRSIIEQNGGQLFISNAEEGGAMIESKLPQILS